MSKLLFFDTESANGHTCSMCSFGYVLTDELFNIIDENDILINPNKKMEKRVLNEVIAYTKEELLLQPSFDFYYEKIKNLLEDKDIIVIGHALENDMRALNQSCERYSKPYMDFNYYESSYMYKEYIGDYSKKDIGLNRISTSLNIENQDEKHTSLQDAHLVMLQTKEICKRMCVSIKELINLVFEKPGINKNGSYYKPVTKFIKPNNNVETKARKLMINKKSKSKYCGKKYCVSSTYIKKNKDRFSELALLMANLGSIYTPRVTDCDIFLSYNENEIDKREICVNNNNGKSKEIYKIDLLTFFEEIKNIKEIKEEKIKKSNKHLSYSFGEIFENRKEI